MTSISPRDFEYVRDLVRKHSAIDMEADKAYLVESRLLTVARQAGFSSLTLLIAALRAFPANSLHRRVVEAMTTNETSFFRDQHPFEALKNRLLPELLAKPARPVIIWCAACSSGQEPYSIAMLINEHLPALDKSALRIIASDLSNDILARAQAGLYSQMEVSRGLPPALLRKYFDKREQQWEIKPLLRRLIEFRQLNLAQAWSSLPPVDIIFLRNVLIYFDVDTKKSILAKARRQLKPGGYLFLGATETTLKLDEEFERVPIANTICYRPRRGLGA